MIVYRDDSLTSHRVIMRTEQLNTCFEPLARLGENLSVQTKIAILSRRLILLVILLYEQFKHNTKINLSLNTQSVFSTQQSAYQSFS